MMDNSFRLHLCAVHLSGTHEYRAALTFPECYDFQCAGSKECIPFAFLCDGDDDCGDNSDEDEAACLACRNATDSCNSTCISWRDICLIGGSSNSAFCFDVVPDAVQACTDYCANRSGVVACGDTGKCVYQTWSCDGDMDCPNGEDEDSAFCQKMCTDEEEKVFCNDSRCIRKIDFCSATSSAQPCHTEENADEFCVETCLKHDYFMCNHSASSGHVAPRCVPKGHVCDSENDCQNGEDEINPQCTARCEETGDKVFCNDGRCLLKTEVCTSAFLNCETEKSKEELCADLCLQPDYLSCNQSTELGARCIPKTYLCDGGRDCEDGEDEAKPECVHECEAEGKIWCGDRCIASMEEICFDGLVCPNATIYGQCEDICVEQERPFMCQRGVGEVGEVACVPESWLCDGKEDCSRGDDETPEQCQKVCAEKPGHMLCENATGCHPVSVMCWRLYSTDRCVVSISACEPFCQQRGRGFMCKGGYGPACISPDWVCDGEKDCAEGEDEEPPVCTSYLCNRREGYVFCNTSNVCSDLADLCAKERGSRGELTECADEHCERFCKAHGFICPGWNATRCIAPSYVCDGPADCPDGADEDEAMCSECTSNDVMAYCEEAGKCLHTVAICDYKTCAAANGTEVCAGVCDGMFLCQKSATGKICVPNYWICDGHGDCANSEDEEKCEFQ